MAQIFPIDFDEKLTIAQDDFTLFSDSEDGNKIKKAQYSNLKWEKWDTGTAATITVWSTTTWAAWSSASVTNSWTTSAAVLDFTIPKWDKGDTWSTWASIVSAEFSWDDMVFTKDDWDTVTLTDAKVDLKWDTWDAATISVWTTTTLSPGSSATVTNSWTSWAAVFNFWIPEWEKWDQWEKWEAATISVGTTTTWEPGTSASVTNSGTTSDAIFNFTIPKWAKWDTWATGSAATISVWTTSTLSPWSSATVTNSGTSSAAVFNFGIPQWQTWATGNGIASVTSSKSWKITTVTITETDWDSSSFDISDWADWQGSGDVLWPSSSVDWDVALFDWTTGKLIKDSWKAFTPAWIGALADSTKYWASLSLSINSSTYVVTAQLKDQDWNALGTAQTIDLPLESVVVSGSYDSVNKKVILTLENGSTIEFSVADLVSGLQSEITSSNKLDADLVDDSTSTNKFVTASDKTIWSWKQDAISDLSTIRSNATAWAWAAATIAWYGNIVTHNTSEFATSTQWAKADTALQPSAISDSAFDDTWDWDTSHAPSKNAVYDKISDMDTIIWWKITNPSGWTEGQVLTKSSNWETWSTIESWASDHLGQRASVWELYTLSDDMFLQSTPALADSSMDQAVWNTADNTQIHIQRVSSWTASNKLKLKVKKVWSPWDLTVQVMKWISVVVTADVEAYWYWDSSNTIATGTLSSSSVTTSFQELEVTLNANFWWTKEELLNIVLSQASVDASNYYAIACDGTQWSEAFSFVAVNWNTRTRSKIMPYCTSDAFEQSLFCKVSDEQFAVEHVIADNLYVDWGSSTHTFYGASIPFAWKLEWGITKHSYNAWAVWRVNGWQIFNATETTSWTSDVQAGSFEVRWYGQWTFNFKLTAAFDKPITSRIVLPRELKALWSKIWCTLFWLHIDNTWYTWA